MWTITLTRPNGTVTTASAVTRADARTWARRYRTTGDTVTITRPSHP